MKLVSAILPTRGRRNWAAQAWKCFLDQTYPEKQLIILDDVDDLSFENPEQFAGMKITYVRVAGQPSIPYKRNFCCEMADGEIICHWDSDDYSSPERMASQVHILEESGKQVCGFHSMLFHVEQTGQCFKYVNLPNHFALGTSLVYLRKFWEGHPFRPDPNALPNVGEDAQFVKDARQAGELISVDAGQLMVARIHDSNTSVKLLDGAQTSYQPVPRSALPEGFFA